MTHLDPWRVLIIDDYAVFRETLKAVLATDAQFHVIAEAGSGEEAIALMARTAVDLLLIALHLPGINGLVTAEQIKAQYSQSIIFILSSDWSPAYDRRARAIGVQARLAKQDFSIDSLQRALQQIPKPSRL